MTRPTPVEPNYKISAYPINKVILLPIRVGKSAKQIKYVVVATGDSSGATPIDDPVIYMKLDFQMLPQGWVPQTYVALPLSVLVEEGTPQNPEDKFWKDISIQNV